jgi:type VI secretion system protein
MELNLRVTRLTGQMAPPIELRLTSGTATIGRSRDSDLFLDDPDRVVSGTHASIDVRDNGIWITDTSRNGTFLNQSVEALPTHQPMALKDGDRLTIGPYEIQVSILSGSAGVAAIGQHPFTDIASDSPLPGLPAAGAAPDILDLLGAGGTGEARPDTQGDATPNLVDDPFADAVSFDSKLAGAPASAPRKGTDHQTPVENVYFRPPEVQPIPDDYDVLNDVWAAPLDQPGTVLPDSSTSGPTSTESAHPQPESDPFASPAAESSFSQDMPGGPVLSGPPASEAPSHRTSVSPSVHTRVDIDASALVGAFLEGLGVRDPGGLEQPEELMRNAGALLRELSTGLTLTLMGRAQFKSELRLGVTTIRPAENNPFKFSVDPNDILDRLLFRPSPGFLPAVAAAREGFDDIRAHEMAMTAGLQAALRALLARFEPAELERRLTARSRLDQVLPMARKSRYWDLFREAYEEVSADAAEDFMRLFGDAFTKAYQEQIRHLDQARGRPRG